MALALWESGDTSSTVIGGLPEHVRNAIFGLFLLVYGIVKRMALFENLPGGAEVLLCSNTAVRRKVQVPVTRAFCLPGRA